MIIIETRQKINRSGPKSGTLFLFHRVLQTEFHIMSVTIIIFVSMK